MPLRKPLSSAPARTALILFAVALATRAAALGNPILHVDEQFYYAAARAWAAGQIPYVDFYDRKPIGLFLIYLLPAQLPFSAGVWAYQLLALLSAWATALIAASIARRSSPGQGGIWAGLLYLVWITLAEGQGGQSPVFFNLPMAGAAWLIVEAEGEPALSRRRALAAMALVGIALQIKPSVVFEGAFFGIWALWRRQRMGDRPLPLAALATGMVAVALIPTLIAAASFAAIGHADSWWFATIIAIAFRHAPPLAERAGNLAIVTLILSPLVSMAWISLSRSTSRRQRARVMLAGWLGAALTGLLLFGTWFEHYALPTMLPASIAAADLLATPGRTRRWPLIAIIVAAVGGQLVLAKKRWERGTPQQFEQIVAAVGRGRGCLYVYAGDSALYPASGRCAATKYTFPAFLTRDTETVAIDQPREIAAIIASRPAVIVDSGPFRGEIAARRLQLLHATSRDYTPVARIAEGRSIVTVYRLR